MHCTLQSRKISSISFGKYHQINFYERSDQVAPVHKFQGFLSDVLICMWCKVPHATSLITTSTSSKRLLLRHLTSELCTLRSVQVISMSPMEWTAWQHLKSGTILGVIGWGMQLQVIKNEDTNFLRRWYNICILS